MDDGTAAVEAYIKDATERAFEESGERDRIREVLSLRLTECGWTSQVDEKCRGVIASHGGIEEITLDEVVGSVKQEAREEVPEEVKEEVVDAIRKFLKRKMAKAKF